MSNKHKKYKSCPDCIDKGKTPSGETRDGIYLECSTCDGTGQVEHPQEGKPLTAEEEQHCGTHRDIMVDLHRREMEHDGAVLSFKKGFNEGYALAAKDKRQDLADHEKATAALREELATLRKIIEPRGEQTKPHSAEDFLLEKFPNAPDLDWYTPVIAAMCSYAHHHTQRANDELSRVSEELERWKGYKSHYEEVAENMERARYEKAKELETEKAAFKLSKGMLDNKIKELDKEKGMRLAQGVYVQQLKDELEAVKKELQGMKDDYHDIDEDGNHIGYGYWKDEYFRMQESASKYLKQRDDLKNEKAEFDSKMMELLTHHEKQLSEVTRQMDEAVNKTVDLCREAFTAGMDLEESAGRGEDWKAFYDRVLSRLSSGETKPANPCIHPEWGTDGGGDYCKKCGFRL